MPVSAIPAFRKFLLLVFRRGGRVDGQPGATG